MTVIRRALIALALITLGAGCASSPAHISADSAHQIDPIRTTRSSSTGWLVARVTGNPRNIEYYLNGVLLETEEPIEWWKDAYLRIQLRPGFYDLEARYSVRAFSGRGIEYSILSQQPIEILPGRETEIEAHLEKDWRGIPATENAYFLLMTDQRQAQKVSHQEDTASASKAWSSTSVPMPVNPEATPEILAEIHRADAKAAAAVADQIVIHGNAYNTGAGTVRIESAQTTPRLHNNADDIIIIGPYGAAPAGSAYNATSSPQPFTLEGAEDFGITVSIESVPAGARVMVDEQYVGTSPVLVRLDPRADHIIEFEREGCGDYVRLLSSTSWRDGRNTALRVQLYCD